MIGYQFLLEILALNNVGVETVVRYCCAPGYTGGGVAWIPGIVDPGLYQVSLFSANRTQGASSYSYGEIIISNQKNAADPTGPADYLTAYKFNGRPVTMYIGLADAEFPAGFTKAYTAIIESINYDTETVSLTLRGRQAELDSIFDGGVFSGDNILPAGLEGVATDLKDHPKPVVIGRVNNITPVLCNTAKLIYAVSPSTGISIAQFGSNIHVYDNGVELYCSGRAVDIEIDVPPAGQFTASDNGYIRLGSTPTGVVTCDVAQDHYALTSTPTALAKYLLTQSGHAQMIAYNSFYDLHDRNERGLFFTTGKISALLDQLVSPGGYYYFDRDGYVIFGTLADPATLSPVFTANGATNIVSFQRRAASDTAGGVAPSKITMKYGRNYTVQANPPQATVERIAWLASEWRSLSALNPAPQPSSAETVIETCMNSVPTAQLDLLADLYLVDREIIEVEIIEDEFLAASALYPGACVSLDLAGRFGYAGKHMILVGTLTNYVEERVTLTLWG